MLSDAGAELGCGEGVGEDFEEAEKRGDAAEEAEAEEADFRFWYEGLSPEERVNAVQDCLLSALKAKGIREIPRLRRVYRVLKSNRG